jgi:hypothetical protein
MILKMLSDVKRPIRMGYSHVNRSLHRFPKRAAELRGSRLAVVSPRSLVEEQREKW